MSDTPHPPPDVPGEDDPPDLDLALLVIADLLDDIGGRLTDPELQVRALTVLTVVRRLRQYRGHDDGE